MYIDWLEIFYRHTGSEFCCSNVTSALSKPYTQVVCQRTQKERDLTSLRIQTGLMTVGIHMLKMVAEIQNSVRGLLYFSHGSVLPQI